MRLTIKLDFSPNDSSEVLWAVTKENANLTREEFVKMLEPALAVIHNNLQAYFVLPSEKPYFIQTVSPVAVSPLKVEHNGKTYG